VLTSTNCLIVRLFSDAVCHRIYNKRRYILSIVLTLPTLPAFATLS